MDEGEQDSSPSEEESGSRDDAGPKKPAMGEIVRIEALVPNDYGKPGVEATMLRREVALVPMDERDQARAAESRRATAQFLCRLYRAWEKTQPWYGTEGEPSDRASEGSPRK